MLHPSFYHPTSLSIALKYRIETLYDCVKSQVEKSHFCTSDLLIVIYYESLSRDKKNTKNETIETHKKGHQLLSFRVFIKNRRRPLTGLYGNLEVEVGTSWYKASVEIFNF